MIKAPISKTGEIKYFEFIKIAILILLFYAFFSINIEKVSYSFHFATTINILIVNGILFGLFAFTAFLELIELFALIKKTIIKYVPICVFVYSIYETILSVIKEFINNLNNSNNHIKLCVIRC